MTRLALKISGKEVCLSDEDGFFDEQASDLRVPGDGGYQLKVNGHEDREVLLVKKGQAQHFKDRVEQSNGYMALYYPLMIEWATKLQNMAINNYGGDIRKAIDEKADSVLSNISVKADFGLQKLKLIALPVLKDNWMYGDMLDEHYKNVGKIKRMPDMSDPDCPHTEANGVAIVSAFGR